jgi:hypothetical protein
VLEGEHIYVFLDENSKKAKSVYFLRRHAIGTAPESSKKNSFKLTGELIFNSISCHYFI